MMDGYDCTRCACVCVYTSFSWSLVALHLLAFSWPGKLPPCWASFIDSFVHSHLNFRMRKLVQQHVAANYGSQLASRTLATLHFDPLGDLCSCCCCCCCWNRPSWLASASVFAVILRRKSLRREGSTAREREREREGCGEVGYRERGCLTESVRVFFESLLLFLCDQRKLIWLVARWLLPVPETLRRRRWQRWRRFISFCWPTFVSCLSCFFLWMNEKSLLLSQSLLLLAEVIN